MNISVLVVEDNAIFRRAVLALLRLAEEFQIIGEAEDGMAALALAERLRPDVIVMDWAMPELGGKEAVEQLLLAFPGAHLIVLSMHSDYIHVQSALKAGASGYILKEDTVEHLAKAIQAAAAGILYLSPKLKSDAAENSGSKEASAAGAEDLAQSGVPGKNEDRPISNYSYEEKNGRR